MHSLQLKQRIGLNDTRVTFGIYKNFGDGNRHLGRYGNPVGLNRDNVTAYDRSSDIINANALTVFIVLNQKLYDINLEAIARRTIANRSKEVVYSIEASKTFDRIKIGFKLEYFEDITKKGERILSPGFLSRNDRVRINNPILSRDDISDRSHIFLYATYDFALNP